MRATTARPSRCRRCGTQPPWALRRTGETRRAHERRLAMSTALCLYCIAETTWLDLERRRRERTAAA